MDPCKHLPELVLNVAESLEDIYHLLKIVKPDWQRNQIQIKVLSGGCSCFMFRCFIESDDSVTVRIARLLQGVADAIMERKVLQEMSRKGYFTPLLALFQNGYCYQYVQGAPLCHKGMTRFDIGEDVIRLVAVQMANIHSTKMPDVDYSQETFFDFLRSLLIACSSDYGGSPSINAYKQELELVIQATSVAKSPLVLIHGDPHVNNIIWNNEKQTISFMDWELCRVAPRAADIAYFLLSVDYFAFLYQMQHTKPADFQREFCQFYLQRSTELQTNGKRLDVPQACLDQILLELKYYRLVVLLQWLIYLVKFENLVDENIFAVNLERTYQRVLDLYLTTKKEVLGTGCFGRPTGNKITLR